MIICAAVYSKECETFLMRDVLVNRPKTWLRLRVRRAWLLLLLAIPVLEVGARTYTIGTQNIDYYPHYAFTGKRQTFATAVFIEFARVSGHKFEFVPLPTKRLHRQFFQKKSLDFLYPDNNRWTNRLKRDVKVRYSLAVVEMLSGTLVRPENQYLAADKIKTIATVRGFTPAKWLSRQASGQVEVFETSSANAAIRLSLLGRTQATDVDYTVAQYQLDAMDRPDSLVLNKKMPNIQVAFHLSTIKHPQLLREFNDFVRHHQPLLRRLKRKYGIISEAR